MHELKPAKGSVRKSRRLGRGDASGAGSYSGRGMKGQKARSGGGVPPWFEGGQLPLVKRLAYRRGFTNIFRKIYAEVNLDNLAAFGAGAEVTPEALVEARILKNTRTPIKILARGDVDRALAVSAHRFTAAARAKIEGAGGTVTELKA
ncbi:MAG: large subunit ribosomal protein L15 [Chloroflexi bacterium]|nr:MAG: large subunit ribosomal protein L15 [Chloroflexota bacterium]